MTRVTFLLDSSWGKVSLRKPQDAEGFSAWLEINFLCVSQWNFFKAMCLPLALSKALWGDWGDHSEENLWPWDCWNNLSVSLSSLSLELCICENTSQDEGSWVCVCVYVCVLCCGTFMDFIWRHLGTIFRGMFRQSWENPWSLLQACEMVDCMFYNPQRERGIPMAKSG